MSGHLWHLLAVATPINSTGTGWWWQPGCLPYDCTCVITVGWVQVNMGLCVGKKLRCPHITFAAYHQLCGEATASYKHVVHSDPILFGTARSLDCTQRQVLLPTLPCW